MCEQLCPICDGSPIFLGFLGHRVHARCRYCGHNWNFIPTPEEREEIKQILEDQ